MNAKATTTTARPCACQLWSYEIAGQDDEQTLTVDTGCYWNTTGKSQFRQGHDAKLKSLMIKAATDPEAENVGLIDLREGGLLMSMSVQEAANRFGFGSQVAAGIAKAAEREAKRDAKREAKTPAPAPKPMEVKVGRWWYPVVEVEATGTIVYRSKAGQLLPAKANSQVREVEAK